MGEKLRVHLTDGRILVGYLHCLDYKRNILLRDTVLSAHAPHPSSTAGGGDTPPGSIPAAITVAAPVITPMDAISNDKMLGLVCIERRDVVKYERASSSIPAL
jgi:small nuclear ribonucleoprotein (snRNP)-like protein